MDPRTKYIPLDTNDACDNVELREVSHMMIVCLCSMKQDMQCQEVSSKRELVHVCEASEHKILTILCH